MPPCMSSELSVVFKHLVLLVYAIVVLGVFVIRNVAARTTIPPINSNLFTFVIELRTISVIRYGILKLRG